jgi:hypothetical protein
MKTKNFDAVFACVFVILLLIPLFATDLRNGVVSGQENRMLADRPPLSSVNHPRTFIQNFNRWFNDHTGFRERLISIYRMINKFQGLGPQYKEGNLTYIIGREGHHFFTGYNHEMIAAFQGRPVFSGEQMRIFSEKLTAIKNYLDEKSIPLIVMFCTDKETVYPEYYPKTIIRGPEPVQLDAITGYLQRNGPIDVFNIRRALTAQKDRYLLYPKAPPGDLTHYNEIGAFFAYRELMKHINAYFPAIAPYSLEDIDIVCDENGTASVSLKKGITYKKSDEKLPGAVGISQPEHYEMFENPGVHSPVILVLRDSYTGGGSGGAFFSKYIAQQFNKTILIHYVNMRYLKQYVDVFHPGIVVFESAERQIRLFFDCINQLDL